MRALVLLDRSARVVRLRVVLRFVAVEVGARAVVADAVARVFVDCDRDVDDLSSICKSLMHLLYGAVCDTPCICSFY